MHPLVRETQGICWECGCTLPTPDSQALRHVLLPVTAGMLDHVIVDAYGTPTELSAIAQVSARGATMLQVNVFDPSVRASVPSS